MHPEAKSPLLDPPDPSGHQIEPSMFTQTNKRLLYSLVVFTGLSHSPNLLQYRPPGFLLLLLVPESPAQLARSGQYERARTAAAWYHGRYRSSASACYFVILSTVRRVFVRAPSRRHQSWVLLLALGPGTPWSTALALAPLGRGTPTAGRCWRWWWSSWPPAGCPVSS